MEYLFHGHIITPYTGLYAEIISIKNIDKTLSNIFIITYTLLI